MSDHGRPNVAGLTAPEYRGVGTSTLRNWLHYWEGVQAGTREITPGSGDTVAQAPAEIAKLHREIEAREREGYAGSDRHQSWT